MKGGKWLVVMYALNAGSARIHLPLLLVSALFVEQLISLQTRNA